MDLFFVPGQIDFLLHCYVSPAPYPYLGAGATNEWIKRFLSDGIIMADPEMTNRFKVTAKGEHWLFMLLSTPYPEQKTVWSDPRTGQPVDKENPS